MSGKANVPGAGTPDGVYPFCTINGGPEYRPYLERIIARGGAACGVCRSRP